MSLRWRLVVAVSALGLVVVGAVAAVLVLLRASLDDGLDKELYALTRERLGRSSEVSATPPAETSGRLPDQCIRDPAAGSSTQAAACESPASAGLPRLAPDVIAAHATEQSAPFEPFDAVGSGGQDFRATAVRMADGRIVVTSVSTAQIDATFRRVAVGAGLLGAGLLIA
ncbi:MAG TPA: hypothetical protein VKG85_13265, partial [Actinomycetes bacterium]|nr:hypothetical protein [Actinomycetes bacterium]